MNKVLLAYSGGLDTTVAIKMIEENYHFQVATLTVDVGQNEDVQNARDKALATGAVQAFIYDAREEFVRDYLSLALKTNALYEGVYPLATALARPLIVKHLVRIAEKIGADYIAHGCTGKGNDQVRFECGVAALNPNIRVIAPMREFNLKRDYEIEYAKKHNIPIEEKKSVYSIDENLWGRSIECGPIEDETVEPPEEAFLWTKSPLNADDQVQYIEIEFEKGIPVGLNREFLSFLDIINALNEIGGKHGIGRIDHIESRLVGIKSHEVYEAPAAMILIKAHQDLEKLILSREVLHFKPFLENTFSDLVYNGLWFSPLTQAIASFIETTQQNITGTVRLKLYKGSATVVGRFSDYGLYSKNLATYEGMDAFDQNNSKGFIEIWSLPLRVNAQVNARKAKSEKHPEMSLVQGEKI